MENFEPINAFKTAVSVGTLGIICFLIFPKGETNKGKAVDSLEKIHNDSLSFLDDHDIVRQGFSIKKIPENLDIIVVGSGVSGLTLAACMAREGKRVLVLEQHDVAGGNTHVFQEKGYEFDTGLHYVGDKVGLGKTRSSLKRILEYITLDAGIEWDAMDDNFEVLRVGMNKEKNKDQFFVHKSIKQNIQRLKSKFPNDVKAIDKYFQLVRETSIAMSIMFIRDLLPPFLAWLLKPLIKWKTHLFHKTSLEVLSTYTSNHDLIGLLTYGFGDYGEVPSRGSFAMNALITQHYNGGGFYPVGGPSVIAPPIIRVIESLGGKVLVRSTVSSILIDSNSGEAIGVEVKGKAKILAPIIVSTAGSMNTYKTLIPENHRDKIQRQLNAIDDINIAPQTSMLSLFVGIKGLSNEDKILPKNNTWIFPSWDHDGNWKKYAKNINEPFPAVFISFPSAKDSTYQQRCPGKHVALVIAPAAFSEFEKYSDSRVRHRGKEYENLKKRLADRLMIHLLDEFPQIKECIDFVELGSPLSNDFYLGTYRGAIYGLSHTPARFDCEYLTGVRTPIKGLYLSGQDVAVDGIQGAAISGIKTAAVISSNFRYKMMKIL